MDNNKYAIIMAGGVGSRFWPVSTKSYPKQFHDMLGTGASLLQQTFRRLNSFIPTGNILILTNEAYNDLVLAQLPMITSDQVILEPAMRNTAPCILYAALKIQKKNPDALMIVAPSDHWIEDEKAFANDVNKCFAKCETEDVLCTLGITPAFPNTGFGYIEFIKDSGEGLKKVKQFREKPDFNTAREFVASGNFLWNAGIFIWSVRSITAAFQQLQEEQFTLFCSGIPVYNTGAEAAFIKENYPKAPNVSIDYAILERSSAIHVLPATFDWNDLGTWGSLYDKLDKDDHANALVNARILGKDSEGNMIRTPEGKLVVLEGINDYIIVDKEDVLLIMPKAREQDIKTLLEEVKQKYGSRYE